MKASRPQMVFWASVALLTLLLLWAGRTQPEWPWFSLWLTLLMGGMTAFGFPRVRKSLGMSWFGVTLVTLSGVCLANVFLYYVESHRQRSERLEIRGVYHDAARANLSIGVGHPDLDVLLEGNPLRFERWLVDVESTRGDTFRVVGARAVETLRVKRGDSWGFPSRGRTVSVLGQELSGSRTAVVRHGDASDTLRLNRRGRRGALEWNGQIAALSLTDPLLDRLLGRRLRAGLQLAELGWNSVPNMEAARDLVITQVHPGRQLGRLTLALPTYRIVSRSNPRLKPEAVEVLAGDTVRVTSRGSTWAFALGRAPSVSRVAAPTAVHFVRRPRPSGWALPSAEACGSEFDRCAIISSERLPPPQPHFDLSGFGLNPQAHSLLARLETSSDGVAIVTAEDRTDFEYGSVQTVSATQVDPDAPSAGYLVRVHRSETSSRAAVLLTVLGLYGLFVSALMILLGNPELAWRLRNETANTSAAWALLNVFIVFLGIRLVLGLRVAYAAPFYDRAASTSVGLWITFALMLVALGRWNAWTPLIWRAARRVRQPMTRLLLRSGLGTAPDGSAWGPTSAAEGSGSTGDTLTDTEKRSVERGSFLAKVGLLGFGVCLTALVWQRPTAGLGILVAIIGLGGWLALGLFGAARATQVRPVDVLTADFLSTHPTRAFTVAAAAAVVLALAIQAPVVALGPVSGALVLFGIAAALERSGAWGRKTRRAWGLYAMSMVALLAGIWIFVGLGALPLGVWAVATVSGALLLGSRRPASEADASSRKTRLVRAYDGLLEFGHSIFSGVAWTFVLGGLAGLTFLNFQQIPPFIRFALVFMLFLLAVRAGLVCRRVLDDGNDGAEVTALGLLVIPLGVMLVFMLFDFGLGLVFFLPMMVTVLLAARVDRLPRTLVFGSAAVVLLVLFAAGSVLRPSLTSLREAETVASFSDEFSGLGNSLVDVLRSAGLSTPITRATVRSVAASNPELIEEALAYAGPSEALLAAAPSLEQVWGGQAYSASGLTGTGLAGTTALGLGVPTVVSYAENAFAVYVLSEHGVLGGLSVLLLYLGLLVVVAIWIWRVRGHIHHTPAGLAGLALTVGSVLWLVLPAAYVAASNLGLIPLTGQNMPFLGLNSWADVVLVSGIGTGVFVTLGGLPNDERMRA